MFRSAGCLLLAAVLLGIVGSPRADAAVDQRLVLVTNAKVVGGAFQVAVQVQGSAFNGSSTLGSATIDVVYDNTKLTFVGGSNWAFGTSNGYSRSATNNTTYIRVGVTGGGVGADGPGVPAGIAIGASYTTWVQLDFTIADASGSTSLSINTGSNAVGTFANPSNNPLTGEINNQTLSAPIGITGEALPIQLASFTATIQQELGNVLLRWSTSSETNCYGFEVQKAQEGSDAYQTIPNSFVAGNGTTVETHAYSFTDVTATAGVWYYRLKQTDLDGAVHYSEGLRPTTVAGVADRPLPTTFALDQNYPNPFNPSTTIEFALPQETRVTLEVYNVLGQRVATLVDDVRQAGYYAIPFNASDLASGLYLYRFVAGEVTMVRKMMLTK